MIHFKSFTSFYNFIEVLEKDNTQYKITGHSYEDFSGVYSGSEKPVNNKWHVKLLLLSSIGSFYYSEVIRLENTEEITNIKTKLATLPIINNEINYTNGIVSID
ncbi:hypothetical protein ACLD43_15385 [Clostridium botulinum]|uniref:hypothetical protein n=1 Tax=Clostridium botulinum TaxID=1491 RepID=UPI003A80F098